MANEIYLNKEKIEEMSGRFEGISVKIIEAAQYTERSQSLEHDKNTCGETVKGYSIQTEKIKKSFRLIIDSFTSEDEKLKKKAEEIVGPQYDKINAGYSIVYDKDGNEVAVLEPHIGYTPPEGTFSPHMQNLDLIEGNCTNSCLAMMIQRYYLRVFGYCDFIYDDRNFNDFYWAVEYFKYDKSEQLPDGLTYYTNYGKLQGNLQADLAHELALHPEGVLIYGPYANGGAHAILITGCTVHSNGTYSFTALDPGNGTECDLLNSTLFDGGINHTSYSSVDQMLSNLYCFQYITNIC